MSKATPKYVVAGVLGLLIALVGTACSGAGGGGGGATSMADLKGLLPEFQKAQ